jgi:hypothetical protein
MNPIFRHRFMKKLTRELANKEEPPPLLQIPGRSQVLKQRADRLPCQT